MRRYAIIAVALLVAATAMFGAKAARAVFADVASSGPVTIAAATMPGPGSLGAEQINCRRNGAVEVELQWTATSASYATSYTVERATSATAQYARVATVPVETLLYIDAGTLLATTTYYYRVSANYLSWSAPSPATKVTTLNKQCH